MKTNYQNASMLDMIFENRNKNYGAYALRNDYSRRITNALLITFSSIFILGFGKFLSDKMKNHTTNAFGHIVVVEPIPEVHLQDEPIEIEKPKLPDVPQSQPIQTIENPEMNVTADNQANDTIATVDQFHYAESGLTTNLNGNKIGATDGMGTELAFNSPPPAPAVSSEPIRIAEIMPKFPGGEEALMKFLSKNTIFPDMEREMGVGGKVVSEFTVNEDGKVSDIKILKSPSKGFDKEVTRVIKLMPPFSPGMQQGRPVKVRFVLPFTFSVSYY